MKAGALFIDNTTASATVARELHAAAKTAGFGFLDAPVSGGQAGAENGQLTVMVGGDADDYARGEPVIDAYAKMVGHMGEAGAGQLTKMVNQIAIAGLVQGLSEAIHFGKQGRPRHREGDRRDLQGRGPVMADGEPLGDDERRQVRLRLRGRLDAQGPVDLPRRGAQQQSASAGLRAGRPVLFRGPEDGRQPLGHLKPDRPALEK
jgi:hypothetical protein